MWNEKICALSPEIGTHIGVFGVEDASRCVCIYVRQGSTDIPLLLMLSCYQKNPAELL